MNTIGKAEEAWEAMKRQEGFADLAKCGDARGDALRDARKFEKACFHYNREWYENACLKDDRVPLEPYDMQVQRFGDKRPVETRP